MFANRKKTKIFTVLLSIRIILFTFISAFLIMLLTIGGESGISGIIVEKSAEQLLIRGIFFGVIALGAIAFEKETQVRYAGIIGSVLAIIGFAVSIFVN